MKRVSVEMKKIGIVVPVYNKAEHLAECIQSLADQTYKNIKIVLVDDGSTDGSGAICDKFAEKDDRISVIHQLNRGRVYARYIGAENLECDYLTFVDADDWLKVDTYEKLTEQMELETDVIIYQAISFYVDRSEIVMPCKYRCGYYDKKKIIEDILPTMIWDKRRKEYGLTPSLCNKLFKKEIVLNEINNAKNLDIIYGDDSAISWPIMTKINTLFIAEYEGYYYRQRASEVIPSYVSDKNFYKRLLIHYDYLMKELGGNKGLAEQIDYHFSEATRIHLRMYHDKKIKNDTYVFPFNKVPVNSKIILYGAGTVGQTYHKQLTLIDYTEQIMWVDKNHANYMDLNVAPVEEAFNDQGTYDFLVIAIKDKSINEEITNLFVNNGFREERIIRYGL